MGKEAQRLREWAARMQRATAADAAGDIAAHLQLAVDARIEAGALMSQQLLDAFPAQVDLPDDTVEVMIRVRRHLVGKQ